MSLSISDVTVEPGLSPISVDGSAVTQPISAISLPLPTGAATNAAVTALTKPSDTQLVDGSAHTQPVSGTFWQATQPVTGTFFQATQPVSIASTVSVVETSISAGTITNIQKTVGTSAVRATVSGSAPSVRKKLLIKPSKNNTGAIYLGSSSVTTANGLELIGPDRMEFLNENNDYFLISDTASQVVEILEVY